MNYNYSRLLGAILIGGLLNDGTRAEPTQIDRAVFSRKDLSASVRLSTPALSPDGKLVAVAVSRPDTTENRTAVTLVLIDTATGAQRFEIMGGKMTDPAWSPQGDRLAWLAPDANNTVQINVSTLDQEGAAPAVVTSVAKGSDIRAFAWSPDGKSLAYLAPDAPVEPVRDARFDRTFQVLDDDYLGTPYLARTQGEKPARLWVVSVHGGNVHNLTPQSDYIQDLAWETDGKAIVIATRPGVSEVSERFGSLGSIDVATAKYTEIVPKPANISNESRISVSSQGVIAYQYYHGNDPWTYGNNVAMVLDGRSRDATTPLDRDVTNYTWLSRDSLLIEAPDHLRIALWAVPTSGEVRRLALGTVNPISGVTASRNGAIAFVGSDPKQAPELYFMTSEKSTPIRLTNFNAALTSMRLGKMQPVVWQNDGYDHDGVLTYPSNFKAGQKYPMLVNIHGGPHTSSLMSLNQESQYYAANGWLVFEPNYRGSDGQGDRYQTAVIDDATAGPGRDIVAGVEAVKGLGMVDDNRVAVTGWSYGGVMTSWLIGHYHDWCAAIPGVLVVDFADYYDQSETGIWMQTILGSPHLPANRQKYIDQSPRTYLDQATTPTLAMQNVGDPNAPVGQAYTLYHALKDRGVKSKLILFGVDGHGPGDLFHERQAYINTMDWMTENCGGAGP
jgi:dipeptidyl aminopeptidase/acylaminoacyl peptidase